MDVVATVAQIAARRCKELSMTETKPSATGKRDTHCAHDNRYAVLRFLCDYTTEYRHGPDYQEIMSAVGLTKSTVHYHLKQLEKQSYVKRVPCVCRGTTPTDKGRAWIRGENA
jgi:DNA-binding transcriptional ArsR family regulator